MRNALRLGLLAVAAALLPSCGRLWQDWLHLTVHNDGAESVQVHAEGEYWWRTYWEDHVDFSVSPGGWAEVHFSFEDLSRLRVRINRTSDHVEIFDDSWDRGDLDRLDLHVRITVHP